MSSTEIIFKSLQIDGWRQFDNIELDLHPRLTVLTGENGVGKSSLLRLFSRHFGFDRPFLATPQTNESGSVSYASGVFKSIWRRFTLQKESANHVGKLTYSDGTEVRLQVPANTAVEYQLEMPQLQNVKGIHIDSHQPTQNYRVVNQMPTTFISPQAAFQNYNNEIRNKYQDAHTGFSPLYRMKEALISMALFGEGNSVVARNQVVLDAYSGFIQKLKEVLPKSLGFLDIRIRPPDVVLVTRSGEFLLDASSGGVSTLIDLTWRLYMFSLEQKQFVVTMDEPENNLHPSMQKSLMRTLISTFPEAQFIIATHSPFMVTSVRESNIYVLRHNQRARQDSSFEPTAERRVLSEKLDAINKAGSASEILREVLGVSSTIPEWVEEGLNEIIARHRQVPITKESLASLRLELNSLGYGELYPEALAGLTKNQ